MKTKHWLTLIAAFIAWSPETFATTRIWDGGGTNSAWTTATNWVGDVAPASGDDLVFPAAAARLVNSNDFAADTAFNSIKFSSAGYNINGNPVTLIAGMTNSAAGAQNNFFSCPITLAADQSFSSSGSTLFLSGSISNGGHTLTFISGAFSVTGVISGSGGLQSSAGTLALNAANTYTGATIINGGFLFISLGSSLGSIDTGTIVNIGGTLVLNNNVTLAEPITLAGTLRNIFGTNIVTGDIALIANPTIEVVTNTTAILSNVLSGVGGVIKTGPGTLKFAGNSPNIYADATIVNAGTLLLGKTASTTAVPGTLIIGDGVDGSNADVVRLEANSQIPDSSPVIINSSGVLDADGFTETTGPVTGTGNLHLDSSIFTVGNDTADAAFDGAISGSGNLICNFSTGAWSLNGSNTFSGTATVNGKMFVNGTLPANPISVSGTLGGTGTVGRVSMGVNGTLSPGLSPGRLTTSNLAFIVTSKYRVELNGTNPGTGYDQLKVNGAVNNLASATLNATLGFNSAVSNVFTIIDNDGTDAVTNTFFGLGEGTTVNISGTPFRISYVGGTGNDVTLTQLAATQQPVLNIRRSGDTNVVLSWATNFTGYILEANTNLNANFWTVVTNAPAISGTNNFVTNAASGPQKHYRLRTP